ncbi:lipocalin [Ascidiimonas aurantiaca]|uniref:lipocalin n=1 Tax=Ascidiimonas aurantiaca TaxID=1685432 RepID=UPI0030EBF71E
MNKFPLLTMALSLFLMVSSCSVTKTERVARNTIDGNWTLSSITYDRSGMFEVKLFNDVTAECLENTHWFFRSNNSTGTYEVTKNGCDPGIRYVRWAAVETAKGSGLYDFTMKFTDERKKDLDKNRGYRMQLKYLDDNTMQLSYTVMFEGSPFVITMNFSRKI